MSQAERAREVLNDILAKAGIPGDVAAEPGLTHDFRAEAAPELRDLAAEAGIDVTRCEFCGGPLDAEHPWRRGVDGACAHEACLGLGSLTGE